MTGENETNYMGMTEEMQQTLARMKERFDAEDAERRKQEQRNATYAALKNDPNYAVLKTGGIDEMIQKKPEILDNKAALEMAIENTMTQLKLKEAEEKARNAQPAPAADSYNPANPTGTAPQTDSKEPLTTQQFMDRMIEGQATLEDLDRVKGLDPFVKHTARTALRKRGSANIGETIAKSRAALGLDE